MLFSKAAISFSICTKSAPGVKFLHTSPDTVFLVLLIIAMLMSVKAVYVSLGVFYEGPT